MHANPRDPLWSSAPCKAIETLRETAGEWTASRQAILAQSYGKKGFFPDILGGPAMKAKKPAVCRARRDCDTLAQNRLPAVIKEVLDSLHLLGPY